MCRLLGCGGSPEQMNALGPKFYSPYGAPTIERKNLPRNHYLALFSRTELPTSLANKTLVKP